MSPTRTADDCEKCGYDTATLVDGGHCYCDDGTGRKHWHYRFRCTECGLIREEVTPIANEDVVELTSEMLDS